MIASTIRADEERVHTVLDRARLSFKAQTRKRRVAPMSQKLLRKIARRIPAHLSRELQFSA
jgi:hypothetical protein